MPRKPCGYCRKPPRPSRIGGASNIGTLETTRVRQSAALHTGQATVWAGARIPLCLPDPSREADSVRHQSPRRPGHRPVPALALNSGVERTARPGLLPPHALRGRTSFRGRAPDDGCPSEQARSNGLARQRVAAGPGQLLSTGSFRGSSSTQMLLICYSQASTATRFLRQNTVYG